MTTEVILEVRPRRVRLVAGIAAGLLFGAFVVVAVLLKRGDTGVNFHTSDQVAMIGIGLALAAAALWPTWPRVRADRTGIEVRNMLGARRFNWDQVRHVAFPDGARWARLELPADEYVPVLAIQAMDGERAVAAMRTLRRLHRDAT
ncbi:MAG TPA: PH domain-containing protein [Actinophytocola sp.]|uniref:PH domain-containing protein n=1 Tax=Actinophytocola sp. TaxID=1872138 RepID=UPI002DB995AB|nr:PH domain-containing protein [Actinophytocola sp.]HEU5472793.1 PH domain-containing protein [Actinophytocola sp.]